MWTTLKYQKHFLPCRTNTWFTSSKISQPSTIIRSTARFFRKFSVSDTSSCICRDKSSSCCRAFCKLFRSTWSWGVCASNSCNVIMYRGICRPSKKSFKYAFVVGWCGLPENVLISYLMHWIRKKYFQTASLAYRLRFQSFEHRSKCWMTFAFGQHLQAVVMISDVLLINA